MAPLVIWHACVPYLSPLGGTALQVSHVMRASARWGSRTWSLSPNPCHVWCLSLEDAPWVLAGLHTNDATGAGSLGRLVRLTGRGGAGRGSIFVRSPIPHPGETPMTPTTHRS